MYTEDRLDLWLEALHDRKVDTSVYLYLASKAKTSESGGSVVYGCTYNDIQKRTGKSQGTISNTLKRLNELDVISKNTHENSFRIHTSFPNRFVSVTKEEADAMLTALNAFETECLLTLHDMLRWTRKPFSTCYKEIGNRMRYAYNQTFIEKVRAVVAHLEDEGFLATDEKVGTRIFVTGTDLKGGLNG